MLLVDNYTLEFENELTMNKIHIDAIVNFISNKIKWCESDFLYEELCIICVNHVRDDNQVYRRYMNGRSYHFLKKLSKGILLIDERNRRKKLRSY